MLQAPAMPSPEPAGPRHDPIASRRFNGALNGAALATIMRQLGMLLGMVGSMRGDFSRRGPGPGRDLRRRKPGNEPEREPVEPDNPRPLSGGAAAPLEFDD